MSTTSWVKHIVKLVQPWERVKSSSVFPAHRPERWQNLVMFSKCFFVEGVVGINRGGDWHHCFFCGGILAQRLKFFHFFRSQFQSPSPKNPEAYSSDPIPSEEGIEVLYSTLHALPANIEPCPRLHYTRSSRHLALDKRGDPFFPRHRYIVALFPQDSTWAHQAKSDHSRHFEVVRRRRSWGLCRPVEGMLKTCAWKRKD